MQIMFNQHVYQTSTRVFPPGLIAGPQVLAPQKKDQVSRNMEPHTIAYIVLFILTFPDEGLL